MQAQRVPLMIARLAATIAAHAGQPADAIARAVLREMETPTPQMLKIGASVPMSRNGPGYDWAPQHFATQWRVAIQSAERD